MVCRRCNKRCTKRSAQARCKRAPWTSQLRAKASRGPTVGPSPAAGRATRKTCATSPWKGVPRLLPCCLGKGPPQGACPMLPRVLAWEKPQHAASKQAECNSVIQAALRAGLESRQLCVQASNPGSFACRPRILGYPQLHTPRNGMRKTPNCDKGALLGPYRPTPAPPSLDTPPPPSLDPSIPAPPSLDPHFPHPRKAHICPPLA